MEKPLSPQEKKILQSNAQMDKVPHYLINQISSKMKNENLIQTPEALISKSIPGFLAVMIFSSALLFLGYTLGKSLNNASSSNTSPNQQASQAMAQATRSKFILLVHNDDIPPTDPMQQVKEYSDWLTKIKATRTADGEHLKDRGWIIHQTNTAQPQIDEQATFSGRNEIGGYFSFEAKNADDALAIAKTCPHLHYKGTLELREIFQDE